MILILVRHGESLKNLADKHGGNGDSLTDLGERQIKVFYELVKNLNIPQIRIHCSNVHQAVESATIVAKFFGIEAIVDERIRPLDIGVLNGLSKAEAKSRYPESANLMESWRNGELEIRQLIIPNAESLDLFWERGVSFIDSIKNTEGVNVVVGTRSILTLLISILLKRDTSIGGGYKSIEIPNGTYISFNFIDELFIVDDKLTTIFV
jgi:broad specificity phosphatase PhoE